MSTENDGHTHDQDLPADVDGSRRRFLDSAALAGLAGAGLSVGVSSCKQEAPPGSDEISKACEESWIGVAGYRRADGSRQRYALAFQGQVAAADGSVIAEVFDVE